jgi:hypothetical protein
MEFPPLAFICRSCGMGTIPNPHRRYHTGINQEQGTTQQI